MDIYYSISRFCADLTILPRSFIDLLEIQFKENEIKEIRGIGDSRVPIIIRKVKLRFAGKIFEARVGLALVEDIPYLLGREDVFDKFDITFRKNKEIVVEE